MVNEQAHYELCEIQEEGKPCICAQIEEDNYNQTIDNQIDDFIFNFI